MNATSIPNYAKQDLGFFYRAVARSSYWHFILLLILIGAYIAQATVRQMNKLPPEEHPIVMTMFFFVYPTIQIMLNLLVATGQRWPIYLKACLMLLIALFLCFLMYQASLIWTLGFIPWSIVAYRYWLLFTRYRTPFLLATLPRK